MQTASVSMETGHPTHPLFRIHAQGDGKEVHSSHVPLFSLPKTAGPVLVVHPLSSNHVPVHFYCCRSTFSSVLAPFPPFPSCSAARFPDGLLFRFFPIHTGLLLLCSDLGVARQDLLYQ